MPTNNQANKFGRFFDELESRPQRSDSLSGIFDQFDLRRSKPDGLLKPNKNNNIPSFKAKKKQV